MKPLNLMTESSTQRVLEILYKYPDKEFSLSDIAKESKVAKAHIGKILKYLQKIEFIEIIKLSKIWRIRANISDTNFKKNKLIYGYNQILNSDIIDFLNAKYNHPKAIILFGSFRNGEDISSSDIDIAIYLENIKEYQTIRLKKLSPYEKALNRKIQLHLFNNKNIDLHIFNNIANGIIISGFLEVNL